MKKPKKTTVEKGRPNVGVVVTLPAKAYEDLAYIKSYYEDHYHMNASTSVAIQAALDLQAGVLERIAKAHRKQEDYLEASGQSMREMRRLHEVIGKQSKVKSTFTFDNRDYHSPDPDILYLTRDEYARG